MRVINKRSFSPGTDGVPYVVDANGRIGGLEIAYGNQDKILIIIHETKLNWTQDNATHLISGHLYTASSDLWTSYIPKDWFTNGNIMLIDNSDAIDPLTGQVVPLDTPGSIPTYNLQFSIFGPPMLDAIENVLEQVANQKL